MMKEALLTLSHINSSSGALVSGNIICAYFSGTLCGLLLPWLLVKCARNSLLPTSTAIISVGASAILSGLIASMFSIPMNILTNFIFEKVHDIASSAAVYMFGSVFRGFILFGMVLGWGISWGSEEGYYHLLMLPLIAVYMDQGHFSVLGTLDMLCLCVPCAGVCSAVYGIGVLRSALDPLPIPVEGTERVEPLKAEETQIAGSDGACIAADSGNTHDIDLISDTALPEPSGSTLRPTSKSLREMTSESSTSNSLQVSNKYFLSTSTSSVIGSDNVSDLEEAVNQNHRTVSPSPSPSFRSVCSETSCSPGSIPRVCDDGSISPRTKILPEISPKNIPARIPLKFKGYDHHIRLGWKGTFSNLMMGDYVEACYPYTLSNRWVLYSVRVSSAIAGGLILGYFGVMEDCQEGPGRGSISSSSTVRYERGRVTHYSAGSSSSSSSRGYTLQSSAYLPLPLSMLLAMTGQHSKCSSGTKLPPDVPYIPTDISDIQILNSTYHSILKVFYQMMDFDHPGVYTLLVAAVLISYLIPFITTLVVYIGKGKLKLKKEID